MDPKEYFTFEEINAVLRHEDGLLFWRVNRRRFRAGTQAGSIDSRGYRGLMYRTKKLAEHRVIWLLTYGSWPKLWLDHIDGNPLNNKVSNLREATPRQNSHNSRGRRDHLPKGVVLQPSGKFTASINSKYLGIFKNAFDAGAAYDAAAIKYHGEFARLNFPKQGDGA